MFSNSSQCNYWMFSSENDLNNLRLEAFTRYVSQFRDDFQSESELYENFLTPSEERTLIRHNETVLRDFCRKFQPPMPKSVVGTAFQYFKRFYLNNSVMDYNPKFIVVTCVYLACKVEEFNVSMQQFVANLKGDRTRAADIVLDNELLLMQQLKYHLTVHNPYRPVEGLMIDLKTRCLTAGDPERFRSYIDSFIENSYFTDACLLYSPSQIALAAIVFAASKLDVNLESYLTDILFYDAPEKVENLRNMMASLWNLIQNIEYPTKEQVKLIDKKLERCKKDDKQSKRLQQDENSTDGDDQPMRKQYRNDEQRSHDDITYSEIRQYRQPK